MCCRPAGGTSPGAPLENLPNQDAVQGEGRLGSRGAWPDQVDWDHQDTGNKTFLLVGDGENALSWQLSEQSLELVLAAEPALEVSRDQCVEPAAKVARAGCGRRGLGLRTGREGTGSVSPLTSLCVIP